jgi:hypothetical protein
MFSMSISFFTLADLSRLSVSGYADTLMPFSNKRVAAMEQMSYEMQID